MAFSIILFPDGIFPDGNWNVDNEAVEVVPMLNDENFKELIVDDGWHEFEPNVLFDNPELITVGTWKVYETFIADAVVCCSWHKRI